MVDQVRGGLDHAPGAAAGTEPTAFAAERNEVLMTAPVTLDPQKPMFQKTALQVVLELLPHEGRQVTT